ncbi:MAG: tRNA (guanosine(37)-N1)-methyltransferase TrmD [Sulfurimonas sp. RIFCSPHIGHO2_12_FULL_36_9]|jgi:tRNA (guanine37-N1)-methyltransferase|uniref:tRNA (guanosine(37)-N1)-methyltransferase TrmD n=1 Tax=unclassified Sulfurimonas TaxID=2623549 RepID=UPI0008B32C32|nr:MULTISPECIES: tRNA (guanosine(37)-N1)-methyltransferase TrmD [unclassified Sulfurimonas]OHD97853.1 MAG: tRNA (guanosine(37)-N1)-methyltransferase TrmD [Sulfurimonas sp. RIFCSPLOWO2_02_FULL_36_28]OHD98345.1 MAG: tRNA (guanosine(37)-N1)-methyltransferase TrmD [Sulfurimonas sp. RIFCSPHIGHO2_12_FULL_36_9]OHE00963.1 MAG: tRNA (guanosine(37)-N1)-methyltransferase TrmD [Sulfurimonas sp. RIFCSPLOWO2_12_36_12]OHE01413.1 MAG: tRNA (guanosine(37)-N1)-methyltransferase TrmD [Sulfurimonas sp. RIFCSPLOWO2
MKFTFVTLFQNIVEGYFQDSILKRAIQKEILHVAYINPRDYSSSKHNKVDDSAVGGGAGMVMNPQPLFDTLNELKVKDKDVHVIFLTPVAKPFKQNDAKRLANKPHIAFVSGRYEGIDERVIEKYADEVFSIGDYILTGGELASLVICDAISRNVDGVLGNSDSLSVESFETQLLEAPSFSKPENYENNSVPSEYLKGNHSKIRSLKLALSECKTKFFRPEQLLKHRTRKSYEK